MCVCKREREREEGVSIITSHTAGKDNIHYMGIFIISYMCVSVCERESMCVCVCLCVREKVCGGVHACMRACMCM